MAGAEKSNKTTKIILTAIIAVILIAVIVVLIVVLTLPNGFVVDTLDGTNETVVYYYVNGEKLVGWQIIGEEKYYFNEDGTMHTGWLEFGGDKYYFRKGDPANTANKPASEFDVGGRLVINEEAIIKDENGVRHGYVFDAYGKVVSTYNVND